MSKGYLLRRAGESPTVPCPCGQSTRVVTVADTPVANLHVTRITTDSAKHYHRACTEYYYVLGGSGHIELGDDVVDLSPGDTVVIEPGTPHRAWGDLTVIVFGVPAWRHDDEFFVTDDGSRPGA
jgi:mannose-6-phosphate isomerase-like protein (cupin superfamily)